MAEEKQEKKDNNMKMWQPVWAFFAKMTGWVAVPALVAFFAASYLQMSQTGFFITITVAFLITVYGIYKEIKNYQKTLLNKTDK